MTVHYYAISKKHRNKKGNGTVPLNIQTLCVAVDSPRRNGISVGGYSKATLWHTLNLLSAAVFPP